MRRLGSTRSEPADVAIIAATSEDLLDAVRARRFREDLYHRLAVVTLRLPPLRRAGAGRPAPGGALPRARLRGLRAGARRRSPPDARARSWPIPGPGNMRELANVMERAALLTRRALVTADALGLPVAPGAA